MILVKMRYKRQNAELLAIVKTFKNQRHYIESCQYEVLVLTDYNNLYRLIDTKSLSFRQVYWAEELFRYHFHINYCQDKVDGAANALFYYPQRSQGEEKIL